MTNIKVNEHVQLTEFRRDDISRLVEYLSDPDIYAQTLRIPRPYTIADAERWFEILKKTTNAAGQVVNWAIRDADGNLLGGIGLDGITPEYHHRAELGYWLGKPFWGRGIMTATVLAVCRHAFENIGLSKITAHTFAANEASAKVLKKAGFQEEGYLKQHHLKDGRLIDARSFGRLKSSIEVPLDVPVRVKQVIVMRHDLGMRRGKQIAQGAHASMVFLSQRLNDFEAVRLEDFSAEQQSWLAGSFAKVCCRARSEEELLQIYEQAMSAGLEVHMITDSGKTEFHGQPTRTCLAIGPAAADRIDAITGHLELL